VESSLDNELKAKKELRERTNLQRVLRQLESPSGALIIINHRTLLNFSSNDYLGLSQHPALKAAAIEAAEKYGAGSTSARLVCGTLPVHRELEETIARFKKTEAALAFNSGYAAAIGAITAVVGADDTIILDKLSHASLIDGARLSRAQLRVFRHNNPEHLQLILKSTREKKPTGRILIITESIFSMDGDAAPLTEIVDLKNQYDAWLLVDEAHALGVLGPNRRGLAEQLEVSDQIEIQMGTLGKAAGASGGFIAGSEMLIDHLINSARSFIFSTAPIPAAAAAAAAGIKIIASEEGETLRLKLLRNVATLHAHFGRSASPCTAIIPIILGEESKALEKSKQLFHEGFFVPAIRYPTVARGQARLRVTLSAAHSTDQVERLAKQLL
jgi:8-amino-7-oxononanoate synthase